MDRTDHLDVTIAKESKRAGSAFCTTFGKTSGKESVLTALVLQKPAALSVSNIMIDSVEDKNSNSVYRIHDNTNEKVSFCEQVESNTLSLTIGNTDKKRSKSSDVSSQEEVQT